MMVTVEDGDLSFQVYDQETGDLYPQVHMESMRGTFVGSIREACLEVLYGIRKACFEVQEFLCPQTKRILTRVQEKYENQLEYLWENHLIRRFCVMKISEVVCGSNEDSWEKLDKTARRASRSR